MKTTVKFYQLAIGAEFQFQGRRFRKTAGSMAADERGWGHVFQGLTEVATEGEPLLLSPEEAAKQKPDYGPWTEFIEREFGRKAEG